MYRDVVGKVVLAFYSAIKKPCGPGMQEMKLSRSTDAKQGYSFFHVCNSMCMENVKTFFALLSSTQAL